MAFSDMAADVKGVAVLLKDAEEMYDELSRC